MGNMLKNFGVILRYELLRNLGAEQDWSFRQNSQFINRKNYKFKEVARFLPLRFNLAIRQYLV
jgi:hypothetical protein